MDQSKKIGAALVSVYAKDGLEPIVKKLYEEGVKFYSTGGTQVFLESLGIPVTPVEEVTSYPSILGGRVKTLHPKVFGGILNRQDHQGDIAEMQQYEIPQIDLVIVDLYPFEDTVASGASEADIIEKIDIGGISLIRAAAKNFSDTLIISSKSDYAPFLQILESQGASTTLEQRKTFAVRAFHTSSHYDGAIFSHFNQSEDILKLSDARVMPLRYGENPHQKGAFYGDFDAMFDKLHGKELSYNNLLDVDAAVNLILEFRDDDATFAILKHNNACGLATRETVREAYLAALAGDPTSAFGGVLISNKNIDAAAAEEINQLFCEVVIAPGFDQAAIEILSSKKNRILLKQKLWDMPARQIRTCLNGYLVQDRNDRTDAKEDLKTVTETAPTQAEVRDLLFASKICKNTKSNTIVLAKDLTLIASGTGQTSRVDALRQAIEKANSFGFSLEGSVMASDAFFPFPDCVEIAHGAGVTAVIQPGGSVKDALSIDFCNKNKVAMVFTGTRHFKH